MIIERRASASVHHEHLSRVLEVRDGVTYPAECRHSAPPCLSCESWSQFDPDRGSLRGHREPFVEEHRTVAPAMWADDAKEDAAQERRVLSWMLEALGVVVVTGVLLLIVHGLFTPAVLP